MKKALIIGIDNYPNDPLTGCVNDAKSVAEFIEKNGDGSPNFEVILKENVATRSELLSLIDANFSGNSEAALFYFAGHGIINELGGYIVTPDHRKYEEGVSMDDILKLANKSKIRDRIIILDCCKSGAIAEPNFNDGSITPIKEGISILTACKKDEDADEEVNGHGVFTNLLLDGLRGGAADLKGNISPGSLYAYIDQALGAHEQRPVFKTNVTYFTSLRNVKSQVPVEILRNIIKYFPTPEIEYKLNPSFEFTNAKSVEHNIIEPFANDENVLIFKELQKFQSVGLVVPVKEEFMYFAAMNSDSCKLTALGHHYWRLVKTNKI